jgi:hypothetical protein
MDIKAIEKHIDEKIDTLEITHRTDRTVIAAVQGIWEIALQLATLNNELKLSRLLQ